jgi:class 3 adenylate cyclase/tetratricopeptide (TPR) repeat protein
MLCRSCNSQNPADAAFCEQCGAKLERLCPMCGSPLATAARFCKKCGAPVAGDTAKPNAPARAPTASTDIDHLDGERKTVTALFADIKGSTELEQDLDPEEARAIVDPALKLMIDAVQRYDGYVVQSTGDGIFAIFGAPVAHEDHPQRALYAALRMQDGIRRYADRLRAEGRSPLQIRIGADTGEVVVRTIETGDKTEYTPIGHAANLASRMQSLANPGSTVIAESTRKLVEGYFQLKPLGTSRVKGIADPVNVYEVTGVGPLRTRLQRAAGRGFTKFVGREREMEAMKAAAERAAAGHGQIVAAMAEAGTGKSRLFFEFKAKNQSGWMVLEAYSVSHGKASAYLPVLDLLHTYFKITSDDDARARREKVAGKITVLDRSLEDTLPYLFALLGIVEGEDPFGQMDAQVRRRHTQEAIKRMLLRESLNQPLMLIFEDLHWIDDETQALLNLLVESIGTARVLLLVNYRPEYSHQWGSKTYYTQLRLDPLGKESADEMLSALVGDAPDLVPLKRLVLERTEGNPFFMEELVQSLFDEGALVRNGTVKIARSLTQLKIPPTVQGILAARIDRLPAGEKDLLQTLSVVGMQFRLSLVRQVVQLAPERLDGMLDALQTGEFVYEQRAPGGVEYTFKHALTHDVAYNSLLVERRRLLHERTAQAIEALYREGLEDHYADLAHHYRSSGNAAKAVEYLCLAGQQAGGRGAYAQELTNAEAALALLEALPQGTQRLRAELGVRRMQARVSIVRYGMASLERLQAGERECELSEQLGDAGSLFLGLVSVAFTRSNRGETSRGLEVAMRCQELAERTTAVEFTERTSVETRPIAHLLLSWCAYRCGDLIHASSLDLMNFPPNPAVWTAGPATMAQVQQALGKPDQALKLTLEALRRSRELSEPFALAMVNGQAGAVRYERREPELAREFAEAEVGLAEEHGFSELLAWGRALRGWAMTELGQEEQGVAELEAVAPSLPSFLYVPKAVMLAQVYARLGRTDDALAMINEELARFERWGAHVGEPELYRLKGEVILSRDPGAAVEAEKYCRKAIAIARGHCAKWFELRAATSLARLMRDTGRRDEARAMLSEIYNWFTEGFDTADLRDARALLEELSESAAIPRSK